MADKLISQLGATASVLIDDVWVKEPSAGAPAEKATTAQIIESFFRAGNYAGGQPNWTPASSTGVAIDTSTSPGTIWWYYSGAWN